MAALRKYPEELRQRAIRLVHEAEAEPGISRKAVCRPAGGSAVGDQPGHPARLGESGGDRRRGTAGYPDGDGGTDSGVGAGGPGAARNTPNGQDGRLNRGVALVLRSRMLEAGP